MAETLTIDDVTPERIIAAAEAAGLKLVPSSYFWRDPEDGKYKGCCAASALALSVDPAACRVAIDCFLRGAGLSNGAVRGLIEGFDGDPAIDAYGPDYSHTFAIGREVRRRTDPAFAASSAEKGGTS